MIKTKYNTYLDLDRKWTFQNDTYSDLDWNCTCIKEQIRPCIENRNFSKREYPDKAYKYDTKYMASPEHN